MGGLGGRAVSGQYYSMPISAPSLSLSRYRMLAPTLSVSLAPYLVGPFVVAVGGFLYGPAASRLPPSPSMAVHQCVNNWNLINIIERAYEVANSCLPQESVLFFAKITECPTDVL